MSRGQTDKGLTLIELVVAMAIFALVAIMGVQSLGVSLTLRDRLSTTADGTEALGQGLALLRNDLSAALPMFFFPPGKAAPSSALKALRGNTGFSLSVGGQLGLVLPAGGMDAMPKQRVTWRFDHDQQRLTRAVWPTLYPASATQQGPEVSALEGVTGLILRSYWTGQGWGVGLHPPEDQQAGGSAASGDDDRAGGTVPEVYSDALPRAIEITLQTRDFGQIVLLEYFQ